MPHILILVKSIIVGTAGHIDHGKTALVKALTGIDADRLQEEKRRGITIDLGFAHLELPGSGGERLRFGFVDVPGHERFVRNMLAGVSGIDLVLLVIAADEGIKPQTREHFDICRLLSIERGITVLTKSDLVDQDTLEVVQMEVKDFLRGSFLENSPLIAVSSLKGTGVDLLKRELVRDAAEIPARDSSAITRLPIDRVFTMKGFGTVVTGTLVSGTIKKEDELELYPSGSRIRVRGVQVHGAAAEKAVAGERTAVNLAGVDKGEMVRGMALASPGLLRASQQIDVRLSLLTSAKPLKTGSRVHLHAFTSETIATIALYGNKRLEPGDEALARLRLNSPPLLIPGDRFIIRQFSPVLTIGGGVVLDAMPLRKMDTAERTVFLQKQSGQDFKTVLLARIQRRVQGVMLSELTAETGRTAQQLEQTLSELAGQDEVVRSGDLLISPPNLDLAVETLVRRVTNFHASNPLVHGISKESLREQARLSAASFDAALALSIREKKLQVTGDLAHLPGRGIVMKDEEAESRRIIEQAFASAGLKVPALKDVLAGLKIDRGRAQKIVTLLLREKVLVKVSDDLVFHHSALAGLRKSLAEMKSRSPKLDVARFKDLTGVSRKYAIPLLEYLDRERVTRREGDQRLIL
jgi:selenocysteine-specific elongation factor